MSSRPFPSNLFAGYIEELQTGSLEDVTAGLFLLDRMYLMTDSQLETFWVVVQGKADFTRGTPQHRQWANLLELIENYLYQAGIDPSRF